MGLGLVKKRTTKYTLGELQALFPHKKKTINQQTLDLINSAVEDPEFDGHSIKNTLLEYSDVMKRRSGSINDYICAIKFVAYVESGDNNVQAYRKAFAHRRLVQKAIGVGADTPEYMNLANSAKRYAKSPMVVDIMTIADVPMEILHQGDRYRAMGVLTDEMINASLAKDRIEAAKAVITATKGPEKTNLAMEIGLTPDAAKAVENTNKQLESIAQNQLKFLQSGARIEDVQQLHIHKNEDALEAEIDG